MASDTFQTQNRQTALMQKIMLLAKLWCDHAEGFEPGLRAWELDVGEWERASGTVLADAVNYTVRTNMAPIFLRNSLQLGTYANSVFFHEILDHPRPCQLEMEHLRMMTTGCKLTLSRKARRRAGQTELAQATPATQTSTPARSVVERDTGSKIAGDQVEEHTTATTAQQQQHKQGREQQESQSQRQMQNNWTWCKRVRFQRLPQPCRIPHRHRAHLTLFRATERLDTEKG